uniref:Uncharacterized protein n=1 Tax=Magallana gigas TaxID=29159 RepID=K1QWA7_MAGGI
MSCDGCPLGDLVRLAISPPPTLTLLGHFAYTMHAHRLLFLCLSGQMMSVRKLFLSFSVRVSDFLIPSNGSDPSSDYLVTILCYHVPSTYYNSTTLCY